MQSCNIYYNLMDLHQETGLGISFYTKFEKLKAGFFSSFEVEGAGDMAGLCLGLTLHNSLLRDT